MMIHPRKKILLAISSLVFASLACLLQGTGAAPSVSPTVDPVQLDAIVAETVAAALQLTASAATPTPAATSTSTPTIEPTASSTPLPQSSITLEVDGTSFFVDEISGFNMIVPPGWLPVRIDQLEYYDAFSLPQAADPNLQTALMQINSLDPKVHRLFIFDLQDGHLQSGFVNNVNIVLNADSSISLKTDDEIKAAAAALPEVVPGLVVQSSAVTETASGILLGVILSDLNSQKEDGAKLALFQKQVLLNVKGGVLVITFTTEQGIRDATLPFFDGMIESIQLGE
jgi:hypothetical protein